ncbi:HNH endonuclease signature motif containing protein [Jiangella alkaliphila]|nr:HNH endonuclease signature motif containing protein [Jiangella alkaliphila]
MFDSTDRAASGHPLVVALDAVESAISSVDDAPTWGLRSDELARLVVAHEALTARLASLGLGLVREADRRGAGSAVGAPSTADWLRDRLRLDHGVAKGRVELAALLDVDGPLLDAARLVHLAGGVTGVDAHHRTGYPDPTADGAGRADTDGAVDTDARTGLGVPVAALRELSRAARRLLPCTAWALRDGRVCVEHAQVIRRALKRLPAGIDAMVWAECEAFLAVHATRHDPRSLARLGSHLATAVTGAHDLAGQREREATTDAAAVGVDTATDEPHRNDDGRLDGDRGEERAEATTMFGFADNGDGTARAYGCFSAEAADLITTALAALAAPAPAADGTADPRGHATRMGDALVELCRRAMDAGDLLPGARGARPHLTITASLGTLRKQPGCPKAVSMWGTPITPEALRRLACDAGVSRVLTDPAGVPLDVGRQHRTVTHGQWVALVARDQGCAFPGCARPAAWTQAHHITHWADGGTTDLNNLVLLCGHHHRSVHHRGWTVRLGADGHPELIPPPWIDPARQPRRNIYHRLVDAVGTDPLRLDAAAGSRRTGPPKDPPDHVRAA